MKYVIIGNSAAAVGCVEGIRSVDKLGKITLISDEKYHTYSRPLISYLLCGKTDEQRMKYRPDDFYKNNGVEALLGKRAASINASEKYVELEDGEKIEYDKLCAATGSSAFIPPMKGLESVKNKFTFMSLDDAYALDGAVGEDSRVLIVGAGLIGLKCAEGIYGKCASITVVDLADRVMPSVLDAEAAQIVKRHIEKKGISFILSDSVESFSENTATLKSGRTVEFDCLALCVGVRPNISLLTEAGAHAERGVVLDEKCRTSLEDVYAAGDCTQSSDIASGTERVLALLPNAYMQGEVAGINMAGGSKLYDKAIAMNSIGFFGLHIITAGAYEGGEYAVRDEKSYKRLFFDNNYLKGYILVGDVLGAGIYTSMIRERMRLDSLDFESLKDKPSLIALNEAYRKLKLSAIGGAEL